MQTSSRYPCGGVNRRAFLLGTGAGLTAAGLAYVGVTAGPRLLRDPQGTLRSFIGGPSREVARPKHAMPGPFPGRVIEVHHPESVDAENRINADAVKVMMDRGMRELTGADHASYAWKKFFQPGDVVGIKVNPVGARAASMAQRVVSSISSPAVLIEVVKNLKAAGIPPRDIVVFERYANEFRSAGYENVMSTRDMQGVRWYAAASGYDDAQLDIEGYGGANRSDRHVVGYDPDMFVHMPFCDPAIKDRDDDRRFRSHLSLVVSRMVNKFITLPVLKDHRSAGVTLSLKNMSHGMNNNVARSHIGKQYYGGWQARPDISAPNQCNTFIPAAVNQELIRQKATLHIMDGLIGVYEGGPGGWNQSWATWPYRSLFFATDPVAMDHVGWDIIDAKRVKEGWRPVAMMGNLLDSDVARLSTGLAALAGQGPLDGVSIGYAARNMLDARRSEIFDRRTPEHVILAGSIGLGIFDANRIDHRPLKWDPTGPEGKKWRDIYGKHTA